MNEIQFLLVEYRNAIYHGAFSKGRREGKGILITDQNQIYIGSWKNDCLNDKALIFLNEYTYVLGDFNRGQMDGDFIYRTPISLLLVSFNNNKIVGNLIFIDKKQNTAKVMEYRNSNYRIIDEINTNGKRQNEIIQMLSGTRLEIPTLRQYIQKQLLTDNTYILENLNVGTFYLGYNKGDTVERLGITLLKEQLVSYGVYIDYKLEGIGCKFENKTKYQGLFKNGLLNGFGLKYQILQDKYFVGYFINGVIKQLQQNDEDNKSLPKLISFKKNLHMQSLYYFNSFITQNSLIKFKGFKEALPRNIPQAEYYYSQISKSKFNMPKETNSNYRSKIKEPAYFTSREQPQNYDNQMKKIQLNKSTSRRNFVQKSKFSDRNAEEQLQGAYRILNNVSKNSNERNTNYKDIQSLTPTKKFRL